MPARHPAHVPLQYVSPAYLLYPKKRSLIPDGSQERRRLCPITVRVSGSDGDVLQLEFVEERHEAFDVGCGAGLSLLEELPIGEDLDNERDVA